MDYIAEVSNNHMGSLDLALKHIDAAAWAGAKYVKFQLFRADSYWADAVRRERVRPYELPINWLPRLKDRCEEKGLLFGVSVFALNLVQLLRGQVHFVKIASGDLLWHNLLRAAAKLNVPTIISTGMATIEEVHRAVDTIYGTGFKEELTILHCVSAYPAKPQDYNLLCIERLGLEFSGVHVGVSDHTDNSMVAIVSAVLGATVLEKHLRLDSQEYPVEQDGMVSRPAIWRSPDFAHSVPPEAFKGMVDQVNLALSSLGTGIKAGPVEAERALFKLVRRYDDKELRG